MVIRLATVTSSEIKKIQETSVYLAENTLRLHYMVCSIKAM